MPKISLFNDGTKLEEANATDWLDRPLHPVSSAFFNGVEPRMEQSETGAS